MSDERPPFDKEKFQELAKLSVVLSLPGMHDVRVRKDVPYRSSEHGECGMDVYSPPAPAAGGSPAVIFVAGYPDAGLKALTGLHLKDMGSYISWARLAAVSGLVAIAYSCVAPPEDALSVLRYVRENAADLNVDPERIGIWACSGNGPTALSLLMAPDARLRFAVLCYAVMLDLDGDATVAKMAAAIGFAAPNIGRSVDDVPASTPLFIVRSGKDEVDGLNVTLDRFVAHAIERNRRVTFVNLPDAPHAFDLSRDVADAPQVVRQILAFMRATSTG